MKRNRFANFLMDVGNGVIQSVDGIKDTIEIDTEYIFKGSNLDQFIDYVYPNLSSTGIIDACAILTPTNKMVADINLRAVVKMVGEEVLLPSADSVHSDNDQHLANYPMEFLNTFEVSGMPSHELILKIGCPVVLLRNLNPSKGLCNGTRLMVIKITKQVLTCKIMNGSHINDICLLPRIDFLSQEGQYPMIVRRRQFPVKLAFAMTINKSQGQSLERVGVYLPEPVFGHGQLYVALSRSNNPNNVKIFMEMKAAKQGFINDKYITKNIVYREILE